MNGPLTGKTVIVTGAGHGLGRAIALGLADVGANVVVNDIAQDRAGAGALADAVVDEIRAHGGQAVANTDSVSEAASAQHIVTQAIAAFGTVDAVVNNAGIVFSASIETELAESFEKMFAVHVMGSVHMMQAALPAMKAQGSGAIVNVTSNVALFGKSLMSAYGAAKGAVYGLTRSAALDLRDSGIRVNALAPMANTNPGRTAGAVEMFSGMDDRDGSEWVVPLVLALCDPAAPGTGQVYSAVAGRYARASAVVGAGWLAPGEEPPSLAEVRAAFDIIDDLDDATEHPEMESEVAAIKLALAGRA